VRADTAPLGFGDPSLLVDRRTGRIFLFHVASVRQGFGGSATGDREDDPDVLQADYSWSDDDGVSWTHRRITAAIKDPAWGGIFAASGRGIQLAHGAYAGRLVQQYVVRVRGANYAASIRFDEEAASGSARARRLLFVNTAHATERANLTLKLSCDDGTTWKTGAVVEAGPSAYATLVNLPGGDVGVLYERGRYKFMSFARLRPVWPRGC
jgi:hypothetical protein